MSGLFVDPVGQPDPWRLDYTLSISSRDPNAWPVRRRIEGPARLVARYSLAAAIMVSLFGAPAGAQPTAEDVLANTRVLPSISGCPPQEPGEDIVVCARRPEGRSPYRIPEGLAEEPGARSRLVAGEAPRASAEPVSSAGCGIFEGQRRCNKREAALYGYGGGRDPVTFVLRVLGQAPDDDAGPGPQ